MGVKKFSLILVLALQLSPSLTVSPVPAIILAASSQTPVRQPNDKVVPSASQKPISIPRVPVPAIKPVQPLPPGVTEVRPPLKKPYRTISLFPDYYNEEIPKDRGGPAIRGVPEGVTYIM